ncbi:outer membrane lipoprotein LolB [Pseudoduganella eburnea]|uniref:Outer-membrane lipoprotein LolB n=1 Tax=Massilia eburnea TaxID=1776165 RepID=A0A6L6QC03_9BURK|nr:outer membrane lipoprotein LolB [Massilia eburnea]MTW09611.1 outer membrane lipoprotein LolB [Massilia eburnea]
MSFKTLAAIAGAAAILCGCATAPTTPPSTAAVAPYTDTLSLAGRLNVRYIKDGKQESATVNYTWKQDAQRTDVALSTQFGNIVAMIEVTPQGATLREGGNKPPLRAPSIDALSARALGWSLPVSGLRGWLQGHATAADGKTWTASPANNEVTTREGWHLQYVDWQDGSSPPRPKRIDAEHPGGGDVQQMSLRIVINQES